ncbi:MAG TPA: phospholipase D-like domain-containing protein [Marmoricola sp.]|nr:phospholipase D-like domain-containing protein [Marmoricola sp.]
MKDRSCTLSRSGTVWRASTVLTVVIVLLAGVLLNGIGATARATDLPTPADPTVTPSTVPGKPVVDPTGPLLATPDTGTQREYSAATWDVLANDRCANVTPCTKAHLATPMTITSFPTGWTVFLTEDDQIAVRIPDGNKSGSYTIAYTITDGSATASTYLRLSVYLPKTPDHYNPPQGSRFSRAFVRGSAGHIRSGILRTINSAPRGSQIRIMSWSFASPAYRQALHAAMLRGVSVQIIMAKPIDPKLSDLAKLRKIFGSNRYAKDSLRGSWVYQCRGSCRGTGGVMHAKIFMFSQSYNTRWIVMTGSGNMTDFAAEGQWNQIYTTTNNQAAYNAVLTEFMQAKLDKPHRPRTLTVALPATTYWFTPLNADTTKADFLYQQLNQVACTNSGTSTGRTRIRIAMYTWTGKRGLWMARKIRAMWNAGCDVRIVYAIMGTQVRGILYSPAGRGRIPMRQTLLVDEDHQPIWYLHQKYIVVGGNIAGKPDQYESFQGSFNFSDLGMHSDENMQELTGYSNFAPYVEDFNQVWVQPQTRAPDPNSYVSAEDRTIKLGTGRYKYMDPD